MTKPICDNCEKDNDLTDINYATKRNKTRLLLCSECFDNFALMIVQLVEDRKKQPPKIRRFCGTVSFLPALLAKKEGNHD